MRFSVRLSALAALAVLATAPAFAGEVGPYASLSAGGNFAQDQVLTDSTNAKATIGYDSGYSVGGAFGWAYGNGLRAEGEINYRNNSVDLYKFTGAATTKGKGTVDALSFMVNGYYDAPVSMGSIHPYIGGGLGTALIEASGLKNANGNLGTESQDAYFAFQAMTGLEYSVSDRLKMDLEYRYFNAPNASFNDTATSVVKSDAYDTHSVMVKARVSGF